MENGPKWLLGTAFGIPKSGFAKEGRRGGRWSIDACPYFYLVFSLLFITFFLSLFLLCYSFLSFNYFLPLGPSLLDAPSPPPPPPLFSSMATTPLYNGLISWNFSLLPLGLYQLFLACCRHPFRTAHQPIGCSATTTIG